MAARRTVAAAAAAAAAGGVGGAGDGGASEACFPGFSLVFFTGFGMARAYNQTTKPPFQFKENYFPAPEMSETRNFGVPENWDSNVFQDFIYVFD